MAQGYTDFSGNTPGPTPPTDWTPRWANTSDWTTGTGPAIERPGAAGSDPAVLTWEVPGVVSGNKEIAVKVRTSDTGGLTIGACMDVQGSGTSGYYLTLAFGTELALIREDSGVGTSIGSPPYNFTFAADTDYWVRFGRNGNDLRVQAWLASGSDPGGWLFTVTDSTYTSGRMGVAARAGFPTTRVTEAGYGTAGDAAPTAPLSGSAAAAAHYYRRRRAA